MLLEHMENNGLKNISGLKLTSRVELPHPEREKKIGYNVDEFDYLGHCSSYPVTSNSFLRMRQNHLPGMEMFEVSLP